MKRVMTSALLRRGHVFPLLALAALAAACGAPAPHDAGGADAGRPEAVVAAHAHHADGGGEPLGAPTDFSLYHHDAVWTDQHGAPRPFASLGGRVQVVAMVYTHCGDACPRMLMDMKRIEAALPAEARERVGFVLVSIDPARDTPARLARYAEAVRLDPARWTLLTAPDGTVRELAALLGVKYRRVSENDLSHTNVITILDPTGEIAHRQVGLGADPDATLAVIRRLVG